MPSYDGKTKKGKENEEVSMRSRNRLLTAIVGFALAVVLMAPAVSQAEECIQELCKKVDAWEILADLSGTMSQGWRQGECGDMSKFRAQQTLLLKMSNAIPELDYNGALRRFGFKFYIADKDDWSKLVWGPDIFNRAAMEAEIQKLEETQGITPLEPAMTASDDEFSMWGGRKALLILSDFHRDPDFGQPIEYARTLKAKYGSDICIYTFGFSNAEDDLANAQGVAAASECGKYYDGCTMLKDQDAFDAMIRHIFLLQGSGCPDEDGDGVCDDVDQCPGTPAGAEVDERGCWIGAYESFFDFNKAVIKKKYMPYIESAANVLVAHPELYVTLDGHTDSIGSEAYNERLGMRRAKAVERAMIKFGVNKGRLKVHSYGETRPIATNDTDEGRAKNRRVEITVWQPGAK